MKNQLLHTPEGVRDIYNDECRKKQMLQDKLKKAIEGYGYQIIQTPTFEYFDIFGKEIGTTPAKDLYKFFDREGNTLVLRPDLTPSVARAAAMYFGGEELPVRLYYMGNTFINNSSYQGRLKENTQLGAEMIGDNSVYADAEMISMAVESLFAAGLKEFQLSVGHSDFFTGLIEAAGLCEEAVDELRELIANKNYFGVEEAVFHLEMEENLRELFTMLGGFYFSVDEMAKARSLAVNYPKILSAIVRLEELHKVLEAYGIGRYVSYELGMVSNYRYYTGIIFAGYTFGSGEPILKGGRYDYVTRLAARCSAKRMYPDYISAKKMRENYEGNVFSCMGCRSFLSPWKDEDGNYKWEGRFNQGVVSLNLPQIGIVSEGNEEIFWKRLDERLGLCYEALMCRHKALLGTVSDVSPIHWQYGAIARLKKGEKIDKLLYGGYSTMSLGYIGLYELTWLMKGCSHTDPKGKEFALRVMDHLKDTAARWREETGIGFSLYGTPAETLCYRFARIDKEKYGDIPNVTDKGYYTNSYHVDVREPIDAFTKFRFESEFQNKSLGGAISYVEVPNLLNNVEAVEEVIRFIYDNIQYGEFNTKSDYCHVCGFDGEIQVNEDNEWECPQCHNKDHSKMNVTRRTCGYLGENFWNAGKTKEIKSRVLHL